MQNVGIVLAGLAFLMFGLWMGVRGERYSHDREKAAIQRCRNLGGEAILNYSYNSDQFNLTGCKLR